VFASFLTSMECVPSWFKNVIIKPRVCLALSGNSCIATSLGGRWAFFFFFSKLCATQVFRARKSALLQDAYFITHKTIVFIIKNICFQKT
jgi:hypothetical protein